MAYGNSKATGLDREAWLQAALLALQAKGVDAVRVEPLAKRLGVTKGSFYWHFKNREALLQAILDHWAYRYTTSLREEIAGLRCGPARRLWLLRQMINQSEASAYDMAMCAWAAFDRSAAKVVQEVYGERIAFVQSQFEQLGFSVEEAEARTRLYVYYQTVEPSIQYQGSPETHERIALLQHELLTGQPPSQFMRDSCEKLRKERVTARRKSLTARTTARPPRSPMAQNGDP